MEVAGQVMGWAAFSAAFRSWPFKAGPRWLGTKARECGLGWPAEPPSVSHLYFTGLGISASPAPSHDPSSLPGLRGSSGGS